MPTYSFQVPNSYALVDEFGARPINDPNGVEAIVAAETVDDAVKFTHGVFAFGCRDRGAHIDPINDVMLNRGRVRSVEDVEKMMKAVQKRIGSIRIYAWLLTNEKHADAEFQLTVKASEAGRTRVLHQDFDKDFQVGRDYAISIADEISLYFS
jgi:hypothetical protein